MDSYSVKEIFTTQEIAYWKRATGLVEALPVDPMFEIRCHELARAVGRLLGLDVQDGSYGFVEHSWCWTSKLDPSPLTRETRLGFPNILDVYSVGQLPMVRLVACDNPGLPHVGWAYRPGKERDDIDTAMVDRLCNLMSPSSLARVSGIGAIL